ncbi:hypothetical protein NC652_040148 [Populus alba x Populus x berolinensis]|uniref:Uncharacterized protein n=1 Tax=Populus alba x Populus x berolinensis TaxID=444605 RepID=A0AAD6PT09_9ROSI|nr:hypothetical protein NC652_040148 [Populus alba x Populus x berolinensis]KAJ6958437.1 hypothetical protein NC653_040164 [Populus alba x Populus x berolinensis]
MVCGCWHKQNSRYGYHICCSHDLVVIGPFACPCLDRRGGFSLNVKSWCEDITWPQNRKEITF